LRFHAALLGEEDQYFAAEERIEGQRTGLRPQVLFAAAIITMIKMIINVKEKTRMNISTLLLIIVAIALLGISVYCLLSYIKERRATHFKSFRHR